MSPQCGRTGDRHRVKAFKNSALHIVKQTETGITDTICNGNEQYAGQEVIHIVVRSAFNGAA
ncbi:hypothetical protein D3C80_1352990 [compost metagenome]